LKNLVRVGPLIVDIIGNNQLCDLIKEELSDKINESVQPDIELNLNSESFFDSYQPTHYSGKDIMNFNKSEYFVGYLEYLNYIVKYPFTPEKLSLCIQLKKQSISTRAKKKIFSLKKVEYSNLNRLIKSFILSYAVFWNVFQLGLLKNNYSFIHGSSFQKNQHGFLLTGTGGSGKTSIIMNLLKHKEIRYLSEDFAIIGSDGTTFYNPKSISLYRTDIDKGNFLVSQAIENLSPELKRKWKILTSVSSNNQLVKISPRTLFSNEKIGTSCNLKNLFYLTRENSTSISVQELSSDEFVKRSVQASLVELKSLSEVLKRITANSPLTYPYKTDFEISDIMTGIYMKAISDSNCYILHIPKNESSENIANYLIDQNLIDA